MTPSDKAHEQYQRLVTLAYGDLHRRGFSETAVEMFLDKRCGVPFPVLLEVRPLALSEPPFAAHDNQQQDQVTAWVQALEYAGCELATVV